VPAELPEPAVVPSSSLASTEDAIKAVVSEEVQDIGDAIMGDRPSRRRSPLSSVLALLSTESITPESAFLKIYAI
jgi:hypothetical protein